VRGDDGREFDAGSAVLATTHSGMTTIQNVRGELLATGVDFQIRAPTGPLFATAGEDVSVYNPISGKLNFRVGASSFHVGDKTIALGFQKEFRAEPLLSPVENGESH